MPRTNARDVRISLPLATAISLGLAIAFSASVWSSGTTRLLYAGVPGVGNQTEHGGVGILVFDMDAGYKFVKRIPTWTSPEGTRAEGVRGIAAHAATGRLFVSTSRRLAAFDLATDKVVWEQTYEGKCCDRMAIAPDGKTLYVPASGAPKWYVVDAASGALIKSIDKAGSPHNTIYSADGRFAYLASQGRQTPLLTVVDTRTHVVARDVGPFGDVVRPFTINGAQTLVFANVNNLLGFEVADLTSGKVLHRVEVTGVPVANSPVHGTPSHGIAMTADEREIWVADNTNHKLHVFDATVMPPKQKLSIDLRDEPGWIAFSLDGRTAFASTGDMIDVGTKKIVATLQDEHGQAVESEKVVEIDFANGKPVSASDQFGKGSVKPK
jgi:DNA-binding beta-propeller fold protein YncE